MPLPRSNPPKARVFIVDDHPLLRRGLAQTIENASDLELCGEADSPSGTILAVDGDSPPDLLILDLMLGNADGLALLKQLHSIRPGLPILVISMHDEFVYAERVLKAGASGFIRKVEDPKEVLAAARAVLRGEHYLSGAMRVRLAESGAEPEPSQFLVPDANPPLSDRELHVFRLLGAGLSTKQIASALTLSGKTIETYRENLKVKLRLSNAVELVAAAKAWVKSAL